MTLGALKFLQSIDLLLIYTPKGFPKRFFSVCTGILYSSFHPWDVIKIFRVLFFVYLAGFCQCYLFEFYRAVY